MVKHRNIIVTVFAIFLLSLSGECEAKYNDVPKPRRELVVFGDGIENYVATLKRFADFLPEGRRPIIIDAGENLFLLQSDWLGKQSLAFFGVSRNESPMIRNLPEPLRRMIEEIPDRENQAENDVKAGLHTVVGCYGNMKSTDIGDERFIDLYADFDPAGDKQCHAQALAALVGLGWHFCDTSNCKTLLEQPE